MNMTAALDGGLVQHFVSARLMDPEVDVPRGTANLGVFADAVASVGAASLRCYTERTNVCVRL